MPVIAAIFLFLTLVMTAAAADITGTWSGTFTTIGPDGQPGNPGAAYLVVKQAGTTFTGTGGPDATEQWPMQSGKIVGNKITAQVTSFEGAVYVLTMTVEGDKVVGDAMVTQSGQS